MINYSFIIPHHNVPDLLNRLLDSIPQRDDIEVIVVDDNSDDDKKPQIDRPDTIVILIPAKESKGAGHARNVGMDRATGKWLIFADSDDKYTDNAIYTWDRYKDSDIDIVFWCAVMCNYDEIHHKVIDMEKHTYLDRITDEYLNSPKSITDIHRMAMRSSFPWNKMISREFVLKIGARFEEVPIHNDAWFSKYIGSKASKIEVTKDKIYCYYKYSNNTTNKKRPLDHYYTMIKTCKKVNRLFIDNGLMQFTVFPGFNSKYAMRDLGLLSLVKLYMYKFVYDPMTFVIIFNKITRRLLKS